MNKFVRILLGLAAILAIISTSALGYIWLAKPASGPLPELNLNHDMKKFERGRYLAHHVAACFACHSPRDESRFGNPVYQDSLGIGGRSYTIEGAGIFHARNITPYALGGLSDEELFKTIAIGIGPKGQALFPVMPYLNYNHMDLSDIESLLLYIKSIKSLASKSEASQSEFPMSFFMRLIPRQGPFGPLPDKSDTLRYGEYLTKIASCNDCHTPKTRGRELPGLKFAGGMEFVTSDGHKYYSTNITPDKNTGIGNWTKEAFISRFAIYRDSSANRPLGPGEIPSEMPWVEYSGMTDEDLGAIYTYLMSQTPVYRPQ